MEGALAAASGTAAMGRGELGVWSVGGELDVWAVEGVCDVRGEFGVWWESGESGVSVEWDGGDGLDWRGEVLEAPPFADFAPRRAFKDLANSTRIAESITDAAPKQTKQQKIS